MSITPEEGETVAECIDCGSFYHPEDLDEAERCDECARAACDYEPTYATNDDT